MDRTDERLDLEFAYTSWNDSCRDLYSFDQESERYCRRPRYHDDEHASGFGIGRLRWSDA